MKQLKSILILYKEIILSRLRLQNDFVGYETHLDFLKSLDGFSDLEGDILEIGVFMGGGTKKLAKFFKSCGKSIYVIDKFDITSDSTISDRGEPMSFIYSQILGKRNLFEEFKKNTRDCKNIILYKDDSKKVKFNENVKLCFSFIDGCHEPSYVYSDFLLAWKNTINKGVICFHDYKRDIEGVTKTIEKILYDFADKIERTHEVKKKNLLYLIKK